MFNRPTGTLKKRLKTLLPACFKANGPTAGNVQEDRPDVLSACHLQPDEQGNAEDGSGNRGQTDKRSELPTPTEERATKALEDLEAERSLVLRTQTLLRQEQEHRREISEQLAVANRRVARAEDSFHQAQERLAEEKEQRRSIDEQLRKVNVLRLSDRREKEELVVDRDRYKAIVQEMTSKRLLAGGTNIQAAFPTLLELQADIRKTLTVSVSGWIEDASPELPRGIDLQMLLAQLFCACQDVVGSYHRGFETFFVGGAEAAREGAETIMDEATASFMRQHMRRHYRTLFPVTGILLEKERRCIISKVASDRAVSVAQQEADVRCMVGTGLGEVVHEYLLILVAALLQHPSVEFATDCGMENVFDPTTHAESIDGDDVGAGDKCIVVFPALMIQEVGGDGMQPLNKKYILPLPDA